MAARRYQCPGRAMPSEEDGQGDTRLQGPGVQQARGRATESLLPGEPCHPQLPLSGAKAPFTRIPFPLNWVGTRRSQAFLGSALHPAPLELCEPGGLAPDAQSPGSYRKDPPAAGPLGPVSACAEPCSRARGEKQPAGQHGCPVASGGCPAGSAPHAPHAR